MLEEMSNTLAKLLAPPKEIPGASQPPIVGTLVFDGEGGPTAELKQEVRAKRAAERERIMRTYREQVAKELRKAGATKATRPSKRLARLGARVVKPWGALVRNGGTASGSFPSHYPNIPSKATLSEALSFFCHTHLPPHSL